MIATEMEARLIIELEKLGVEAEYWNTGGGCMMVAAIISRDGGTPETRMGEPTGRNTATRYVGITHNHADAGWMAFAYDERSTDDADYDGRELPITGVIPPDRADLVASFVAGYVQADKWLSDPRVLAGILRDRKMPGRD